MLSIQANDLTKNFGPLRAVDRLHLEVAKGEIFGLVGPDGSGKTTTLRMLCGILPPDGGEARVEGCLIPDEAERLKEKVGYLPQRSGTYGDLTVLENVHFYADLYRVPKKERRSRLERLLRFSNLEPFQKRKAQDLSGGMRQKLGLICALIHTPELLLLDEPTAGVDPLSRRELWLILYELLKEGVTILLSTSYVDEAERCNRVGLIYQGALMVSDAPARLKANIEGTVLELRVDDLKRGMRVLKGAGMFRNPVQFGDRIHLLVGDVARAEQAIRTILRSEGLGLLSLTPVMPSLEDVFVSFLEQRGSERREEERVA